MLFYCEWCGRGYDPSETPETAYCSRKCRAEAEAAREGKAGGNTYIPPPPPPSPALTCTWCGNPIGQTGYHVCHPGSYDYWFCGQKCLD
ncbi:MAG: hypothetical protein LBP19_07145, partial [Treponema sp.]|nr:hypothetical protein [Treponema sp.]